ncbi:hypothetical protein [Marinobacter sp.]|uniref:hypothetical protein n=1 Tax=Marinobacter sp. TaxID=50741 RepID=UPI00384F671A
MSGIVIVTGLMLAGLLTLLAVRVLSLSSGSLALAGEALSDTNPGPSVSPAPRTGLHRTGTPGTLSGRPELLARLHILFSLQERDTRDQGLDIRGSRREVREYAIAWFYGAACALAAPGQRHTEELVDTMASLMARKLEMTEMSTLQAITTLTDCSTRLACFRSGLEGAESWLERRYVPSPHSLYTVITSNALV